MGVSRNITSTLSYRNTMASHDVLKSKYWFGSGEVRDALLSFIYYTRKPMSAKQVRHYIRLFLEEDIYYQPSNDMTVQYSTMEALSGIQGELPQVAFIQIYGNFVQLAYMYDMIRTTKGENVIETQPQKLQKLMKDVGQMIVDTSENKDTLAQLIAEDSGIPYGFEVVQALVFAFSQFVVRFYDLLCSKYCSTTQQKKTKAFVDIIRKELMETTWHPSRVIPWCLDEEEKMDICFTLNNHESIL